MSEKSEAQKHRYWVERDSIAIVKKSDSPTENKIYDSPLGVETVNLMVVKLDEDFVDTGSVVTTGIVCDAPAAGVQLTFTSSSHSFLDGMDVTLSGWIDDAGGAAVAALNGITSQVENVSGADFQLEGVNQNAGETILASTGDATPTNLTGIGITESPSIPEEFHEAIVDYAIMKGYEMSPEGLASAQYFKTNFKEQVMEGKKYSTKNRRGTTSTIIPQDF